MTTTFTFAGDEAGDISFKFDKGASRYFVVTVIATKTPDDLRDLLTDSHQKAHLPKRFDFHFNSLASAKLRNLLFSSLAEANFEDWAIVVDKTSLPDTFKLMSGLDVYLYLVSELIRQIPEEKRSGGTLILDEFGYPQHTKKELKRILKTREIKLAFRRIPTRRSQSESLIQVTDLVAGAILRRDSRKQSEVDAIERRIRKVMEI